MFEWSDKDYLEVKKIVHNLPAGGSNVVTALFLNKILVEIKKTNEKMNFKSSEFLMEFKNDTLKALLDEKKIDHKDCKNKDDLIKKLLGD